MGLVDKRQQKNGFNILALHKFQFNGKKKWLQNCVSINCVLFKNCLPKRMRPFVWPVSSSLRLNFTCHHMDVMLLRTFVQCIKRTSLILQNQLLAPVLQAFDVRRVENKRPKKCHGCKKTAHRKQQQQKKTRLTETESSRASKLTS